MKLIPHGKGDCLTIGVIALMLIATFAWVHWWIPLALTLVATVAVFALYRDPYRAVPTHRNVLVSPVDGVVRDISKLDKSAPIDEPVMRIRIATGWLDVHAVRAPCHATLAPDNWTPEMDGPDGDGPAPAARRLVMVHPTRRYPIGIFAPVEGESGLVLDLRLWTILQRGEPIGMVKLSAVTEVILPIEMAPKLAVREGQRVQGGSTILANLTPPERETEPEPEQGSGAGLAEVDATKQDTQGQAAAQHDQEPTATMAEAPTEPPAEPPAEPLVDPPSDISGEAGPEAEQHIDEAADAAGGDVEDDDADTGAETAEAQQSATPHQGTAESPDDEPAAPDDAADAASEPEEPATTAPVEDPPAAMPPTTEAAWPFEEPPDTNAVAVRQIVNEGDWVQYVSHDAVDRNWQFMGSIAPAETDAVRVTLGQMYDLDPSIGDLADLPLGQYGYRPTPNAPWQRAAIDEEAGDEPA